jgi:hypothetical protein
LAKLPDGAAPRPPYPDFPVKFATMPLIFELVVENFINVVEGYAVA